jgi:hypothetical protein
MRFEMNKKRGRYRSEANADKNRGSCRFALYKNRESPVSVKRERLCCSGLRRRDYGKRLRHKQRHVLGW